MSIFRYTYYDSPDGKDLVKKLFYTNKHVTVIGFGLATTDIMLYSKPVGYLNTARRYAKLMGPMYIATSTFCLVTYVSTRLRGKDDEMNYALAGFTAGVLMGPFLKQNLLGAWLGITCAIIGAVKKNSKLNGWEFYPEPKLIRKSVYGDFRTPYRNWTLYDERPKEWKGLEQRIE